MKLRAIDTLHVSQIKSTSMCPGEEFEADDEVGQSLIERGLATLAIADTKAAEAPKNKMARAPKNKSGKSRKTK